LDDRNRCSRIDLQKSIILSESQKQDLLNHAKKFKPNESCAILFGTFDNDEGTVQEVFLAYNIEESPVNFTISNEDLIKAYGMAEEKKLDIVGIFHSHPSSEAYPSNTDQKFMQANPIAWLIFSENTNDLKAFVLESEINEIPIKITS